MAGNSNAVKSRLNRREGLEPLATKGRLWKFFLQERDRLKQLGHGSPQSRNREAESAAVAYAVEQGIGSSGVLPGEVPPAMLPSGDTQFLAAAKPAAELAQADSMPRLDVKWVAANLLNLDADPKTAPSKAAWGLLHWARHEPGEFYKGPYGRLLPTKAQVDDEADQVEDDELEHTIDFVYQAKRDAVLPLGSEASAREPSVPAERIAGGSAR